MLADVIPPDVSPLHRRLAAAGLRLARRFLKAALAGLVRTAFSDYRKLRAQYGLRPTARAQITALIAEAGYEQMRRQPNFGHNPHRMTFKARKPQPAAPAL